MNKDTDYKKMLDEQFEKVEELFNIKVLTPQNTEFAKTQGGFLSLKFQDKEYPRVAIYRVFPFSEPNRYLSVRDVTPKAEEIGLIDELDIWPEDIRENILEQLEMRYFTPVIRKINDIKEEYGFAYWRVETDRGDMNFTTTIWNPIVRITEKRLLISDLDSNRFEILDFYGLTKKEQKMIDLFL